MFKTDIKFISNIKDNDHISEKSILQTIKEIRTFIGNLEPSFNEKTSKEVLGTIENKEFVTKNNIIIDLREAENEISYYRNKSQDPCCYACKFYSAWYLDAGAYGHWVRYCGLYEPNGGGTMSRRSPALRRHKDFSNHPCKSFRFRFPKTIEELLKDN